MSFEIPDARHPDHPVDPRFPARWSPRSFTDRGLTVAEVMSLFEAARWAPSSSNRQPWRFVWALRGEAEFGAILGSLTGNNPTWAGKAAVLIAVASKDTIANRDGEEVHNRTAGFDTGAAWVSIALQAQAMGLAAHAMGGFNGETLSAAVGLPKGHSLHCVVAVGEKGPADSLPEALRERETPNSRKPVEAFALRGRF
jgi:nitroreductase